MTDKLPPIYFYIPQNQWSAKDIPESADTYLLDRKLTDGVYAWTLQTYLRLKNDGFPCQLVGTVPTEGIVFAHQSSLPANLQPRPKLLIVCLQADKEMHPYAQLHVVPTPQAEKFNRQGELWNSYYLPHWPQPGLIPRDRTRGDKFENVAYFGLERNLAPELRESSWEEELKALGLRWDRVTRDRWHDFSQVDAIVAVRSFQFHPENKPPQKLYNSWYAGVPAILGCESAFQAERKSELDYLEVSSFPELISALKRLRDDKELRYAMMENARFRAEEIRPEASVLKWRDLITNKIVPAYESWCKTSNFTQKISLIRRYSKFKSHRIKNRIQSLLFANNKVIIMLKILSFLAVCD
ncbi:hypothetical protein [Floridanema evergladense]|uniref:Glycosyltransferase family 1 protein n=1 Tax=Floridaenema evergladense BLCC-F167 TaxID=3153639 RepID=A0ABV4WL47_9CYAN